MISYYYSDIHEKGIMYTLDFLACTIFFLTLCRYLIITVIYMQKVIIKGLCMQITCVSPYPDTAQATTVRPSSQTFSLSYMNPLLPFNCIHLRAILSANLTTITLFSIASITVHSGLPPVLITPFSTILSLILTNISVGLHCT